MTLPLNATPPPLGEATQLDALGEQRSPRFDHAPVPGQAADLIAALSLVKPGEANAKSNPPPGLPASLPANLAARIAASRAANAPLTTVRHPQRLAATRSGPGWQAWPLHKGSRLVALSPGAVLPSEGRAVEWLVLRGRLQTQADGADVTIGPQGYALTCADTLVTAAEPTLLYQRQHGDSDPFHTPAQALLTTTPPWQPLRPGVDIAPLHAEGGAVSLLARFAAGASVPAHPHGVDEECLMVDGELFLGDVLLPEGGYQFAPHGTSHGALFADRPCVLFFHGAIDAAAVDNPHRQQQGWPIL